MARPMLSLDDSAKVGWAYWQALIAGQEPPNTHRDFAPIGFYRWDRTDNRRGHSSTAVAIWVSADGSSKFYKVGKGPAVALDTRAKEEDFCDKSFSRFSRKAIPHAVYLEWMASGEFPKAEAEAAAENSRAVVGNNSNAPPFEVFNDQATILLAAINKAKVIETDEQASAAQTLRNRLTEVAKEGDEHRAIEKKPHWDAGVAVDTKWNPRITELRKAATTLRTAQESFANKKARAKREEAERRAAEANPVIEKAQPERIEAAHGKASTVKTVLEPTIVDYDKVYALYKNNDEVKAVLRKIVERFYANAMAPGMPDIAGVESVERSKIR